jgi:general secretion pathway protein D
VHAGREVSLKISMDISAVTGSQDIGGITQPIIGQRKVEHEIRLKDGEVNLLGGILENQQTKSLSGIPGLAQIPILKYLFSQTTADNRENEIVFVIIPHVIRGADISEMNQRAIDIGTSSTIELRHVNRAAAAPAASTPAAQPAPGQAPNQAPTNPAPGSQVPPNPAPANPTSPAASAASGANFMFDPATITATKGGTFVVNLLLSGAQNVYSVPVQLNYDPALIQLVNVSNGGFLSQDGQAVALVHREDETSGTLQITATRPPGAGGVSGQGTVVTMTFQAKSNGQTPLTITRGGARDPGMQAITVNGAQASVTIQ